MRFLKRKLHFLFLSFLCWRQRNRKWGKNKMEKGPPKPIKLVLLRWSFKIGKWKKGILLQKLPDTSCVRKGEERVLFVHTICFGQKLFGPKQWKPSGNCPKPKMAPFFFKMVFLTWVKTCVLLIVFLKAVLFWKHSFYSVFSKTQQIQ